MVRQVGHPAYQPAAVEHRRDNGNVRQMGTAAVVRVIADEHVALLNIRAVEMLVNLLYNSQQGAKVHGDMFCLRHHVSVRIKHRGGNIAALLDVGGIGTADDRDAGFLCNG